MANPLITQAGAVFARRPDTAYVPGGGRIKITADMVGDNLVATFTTTAPFEAILDERGTYWRLRDRDVVVGEDTIQVNLYSIYEIRNMINAQATITVSYNDNGTTRSMTLTRFRESDPIRGFAWRYGTAAVYTTSPVPAVGMAWYSDPHCTTQGGTVAAVTMPNVDDPDGDWYGVFSDAPNQISYSVVSTGTYAANAQVASNESR